MNPVREVTAFPTLEAMMKEMRETGYIPTLATRNGKKNRLYNQHIEEVRALLLANGLGYFDGAKHYRPNG